MLQKWSIVWRFLLIIAIIELVLRSISGPQLVCCIPESECFLEFVDVTEDDPLITELSCKKHVLNWPDRIPDEYLLPQWDVMEYREPDFVKP